MRKARNEKLLAQERRRAEARRRQLYTKLRLGLLPAVPGRTRTVRFGGEEVQVSEADYLWLVVRDHIQGSVAGHVPTVLDQGFLTRRREFRSV